MTVTLNQVFAAEEALKRLSEMKLPVKAAWAVSKLLRLAGAEIEHAHSQRNGWITELGTEKDGQKVIEPDSPGRDEFFKRLTDLMAVEVEIAWTPLAIAELGEVQMAPGDLLVLEPFLKDE